MSLPVRVLYDIHPRTIGGTERFLARLLPRMVGAGYEPLVMASHNGAPQQLVQSLGIETVTEPAFFTHAAIRPMAELIRRRGVRLVQSNYYSAQLALAAQAAGVPHIWRLGGHVTVGSGARSSADVASTLQIIRLLSRVIVCNSLFVKRQFRRQTSRPPVRVIPNGVTLDRIRAATKQRGPGPLRVAMIAHFTAQKRHEDFIRAAGRVAQTGANVTFAILGEPYGHADSRRYAADMHRLAGRLLARGQLIVAPFDPRHGEAIGDYDLIVLPSIGESFSNAILEAMAAGVPVLATRSGGNAELVQHRRTGWLVPPRRPALLAEAMLACLSDRRQARRMGHAGRTRAHRAFSMEVCAGRYTALYREVLTSTAR